MNDPRVVELKGLEYVIDRLPRGIERCNRIILTEEGGFEGTNFEKIEPPKRRRISFMVSATEMCFVITRGLSEIYDIMTHLTFLTIEAKKIQERMRDESGHLTVEWKELEKIVHAGTAVRRRPGPGPLEPEYPLGSLLSGNPGNL